MAPAVTFGGVEALLVPAATSGLGVRVATETPADLQSVAPLVQLAGIGGGSLDDDWTFRQPTVSADSFASSRLLALELAESVEKWFRVTLPGSILADGSVVTKVQTVSGPSWRPWDDTNVRRYGATYRVFLKTQH